jgi:hypothetical protein
MVLSRFPAGEREVRKVCLGDSVYATIAASGQLVLTTENGFGPSNIIVLEPEVIAAMEVFIASWRGDHHNDE